MTEPVPPEAIETPAAVPKRRHWGRIVLGAIVGLVLLAVALVGMLDTGIGHRFLTDRIAALRPANGLRYQIGRIEGSIYGKARLIDVRVRDRRGLVFAAPARSSTGHRCGGCTTGSTSRACTSRKRV